MSSASASPPEPAARNTAEVRRLATFIVAMIPIAIAYGALYVIAAVVWDSVALAGAAAAVAVYLVMLVWAHSLMKRGLLPRAALTTGSGLLVMVAIGAVFVYFQRGALVLITVASVVVVLPHISRRALIMFACVALAITVEILIVDGALPPLFPQPPRWFQVLVHGSAMVAASALVYIMLSADHERLRATATEANAARDATEAFLVAAAHQLRTPVSTILLQGETLRGTLASDGAAVTRLDRIVRQATRLQQVVDTMLDLSRANVGMLALETEPVDLAEIVREVVAGHERAAADAGTRIEIDAPPMLRIEGDARRLAVVTSNLVDNAIKFGRGTPVRVVLQDEPDAIELRVEDRGNGMSTEEQARCFDRDFRTSSDGSLGVGLWLVQQVTLAMGGTVSVRDRAGGGTMFVVRIPRSP